MARAIRRRRAVRAETAATKASSSAIAGASANSRSTSSSKPSSTITAAPGCGRARLQALAKFIQTTFDMGFDRTGGHLQERTRFAVGKTGPGTHRHTDPFGGRKLRQSLVEIELDVRADPIALDLRRRWFGLSVAGLGPPAAHVEAGGDLFQPAGETALPAKAADVLKRSHKSVLGEIVGQRRLGPHAPQQRPHHARVAPDQGLERR